MPVPLFKAKGFRHNFSDAPLKKHSCTWISSVMSTDILDKDLVAVRKKRWDNAFSNCQQSPESLDITINRKATLIIEHVMQTSDVAHTMQDWHIYLKWNERLFEEMYKAYKLGRSDKDPSEGWYEGELGFFDFYLIPLAKKMKECGVFGVAGEDHLKYAEMNRTKWVAQGRQVVHEYKVKYSQVYSVDGSESLSN